MTFRLLCAVLAPALCAGQASDAAASQKVLDELKGIRAALERVEQGQRALLALSRMQADSARLASLEAQQSRLAAQERDLNKQAADANHRAQNPPMVLSSDGVAQPAPVSESGPYRAHLAEVSAALKDVSQSRLALDEEIARIKSRIAAMEKLIDEALK